MKFTVRYQVVIETSVEVDVATRKGAQAYAMNVPITADSVTALVNNQDNERFIALVSAEPIKEVVQPTNASA